MDTSYFRIKVIPEDRQIYIDLILQSPNRLNSFIILSQNRDDINFVRYVFEKKNWYFYKTYERFFNL